jgi:hypothetical protein
VTREDADAPFSTNLPSLALVDDLDDLLVYIYQLLSNHRLYISFIQQTTASMSIMIHLSPTASGCIFIYEHSVICYQTFTIVLAVSRVFFLCFFTMSMAMYVAAGPQHSSHFNTHKYIDIDKTYIFSQTNISCQPSSQPGRSQRTIGG